MPSVGFKELMDAVDKIHAPRGRRRGIPTEPVLTAKFIDWYRVHRDPSIPAAKEATLVSGNRVDALIVGKRGIVVVESKRVGPDFRDIGQAIGYGLEVQAMAEDAGCRLPVNVVLVVGRSTKQRVNQKLVHVWRHGFLVAKGSPVQTWPKELGRHDLMENAPNLATQTMRLFETGRNSVA